MGSITVHSVDVNVVGLNWEGFYIKTLGMTFLKVCSDGGRPETCNFSHFCMVDSSNESFSALQPFVMPNSATGSIAIGLLELARNLVKMRATAIQVIYQNTK